MTTSHIISSLVDTSILIAFGIVIPFIVHKFVQMQVLAGKTTPEKGTQFKKYGMWFGLFLIAFGIFAFIMTFKGYHL